MLKGMTKVMMVMIIMVEMIMETTHQKRGEKRTDDDDDDNNDDDYFVYDLPENFNFQGLAEAFTEKDFDNMFKDVSMQSVFEAAINQEKEKPPQQPSSLSDQAEEIDFENMSFISIAEDPYLDYLYTHKYVSPKGDTIAVFDEIINAWFSWKRAWKLVSDEERQTWLSSDSTEEKEFLFITSAKDVDAVRNDRSRIVCWSFDEKKTTVCA
ncbi:hypothetical protein E3N88_38898 [Mikania micrantha]|uniref:Uncharacterized protein n=1 Tax=Mikania micrantha TaxID=192012 RepID=A0A5N6LVG0_9ASTR|nr:hypothetical protein E3N88_38898 [Mikania micrantha]